MSLFNDVVKTKYKILLVAYKDLSEEVEKELNYHFISKINSLDDLRDDEQCGDYRSSAGLTYRTCVYHSWFRDAIKEKLKNDYILGIVEKRKDSYNEQDNPIKKLEKLHKGNILIVDEAEL